jgi:spore coat polysaccharide biosynthesis protein SpsF
MIVAIVQARMGSTRLPGKVLLDLGGKTVLGRVLRRLQRSTLLEQIVVATSTHPADDTVVEECSRYEVSVFRGDEADVLDRFYQAAKRFEAQIVVRITADCPLIDAEIIDKVIREFTSRRPDYASNTLRRTYPRGLDTEVMTFKALQRSYAQAGESYQRAHVTPFIYQNPDRFEVFSVENEIDYSDYRWTLDTAEDLQFLRAVFQRMNNRDDFSWRDVLQLLESEPQLMEINGAVLQKVLHEG